MFTHKSSLMRESVFALMCLFMFGLSAQSFAEEVVSEENQDLFEMSVEQLMEVEVESTATLTDAKPRLVPAAVTTITQEQIQASGARSLYELLDIYVPNFQWVLHSAKLRHMGLRGIISNRDDKYLLLVNSRVMNEKTDFGVMTERDLPMLSDIHHIDVIRGPGSALYGPGALAMVINIITDNAMTFQGTESTLKLGSIEEFYSGEIKYGSKFDDDSGILFYVGASHYPGASSKHSPTILGRQDTIGGETYQAGDQIKDWPNSFNESFRDKIKCKLHGQYTNGGLDIWVRYTTGGEYMDLFNERLSRRWFREGEGYRQGTFYSGYKQEISPEFWIRYVFSFDRTEVETEDNVWRPKSFRENEYYSRIIANWKPHKRHSFAFGGEWSHEQFGRRHSNDRGKAVMYHMTGSRLSFANSGKMPKWSTDLKSLLGEYQWNINDRLTTFLSGRIDKHDFTETMFSPRATLVYTPNSKDTIKIIGSRSVRTDTAAEMKKKYDSTGEKSDVEVLKALELRYERQHTDKLYLAGSIFRHWHDVIGWGSGRSLGKMNSYGIEVEASYRKGKNRIDLSHSLSKLLDFNLRRGLTSTELTAEPMGFGSDLSNWSNHITKLIAHRDLNDRWKLDSSVIVYWGYPGGKDYADYQYSVNASRYKPGFTRSFRPSVFWNLGLMCNITDNKTLRIDGYNLLGLLDRDLNKRRVGFNTDYPAQVRFLAPSIGVSYIHKY